SQIEVEDIAMSGLRFTWNRKSGVVRGLLKKLDIVLGNSSFKASFPTSYSLFLPFMLSNHTLAVFVIPEFVLHFKNVLGSSSNVNSIDDPAGLFSKTLPESEAEYMIRSVMDDEIKKALFEIDGNKASGPDGYSA
nr:hypothetical protein [Tanacetum cinerariifolium]